VNLVRILTDSLIVLGYIVAGAVAATIGGVAFMHSGGSPASHAWWTLGGALVGLLFGLRRARSTKS